MNILNIKTNVLQAILNQGELDGTDYLYYKRYIINRQGPYNCNPAFIAYEFSIMYNCDKSQK